MLDYVLQFDYLLFDFINEGLSNVFFDFVMPYIRNKKTWIPLYIILFFFIVFRFNRKEAFGIIILSVLCVTATDAVSSHLLKPYFHRIRPCDLPNFSSSINLLLSNCSGAFSFPSSHAANHFALATFWGCAFYKSYRILSGFFLLWASLICFAQVYVGVHFPSDVLAGAILGVSMGFICFALFYQIKKPR